MQQTAITAWQPIQIVVPTLARPARWGLLAFASLALPVAIAAAALSQSMAPTAMVGPTVDVAPSALEVLPAPAPPVEGSTLPTDGTAPALPSYFFIDWAAECETECPALVAP